MRATSIGLSLGALLLAGATLLQATPAKADVTASTTGTIVFNVAVTNNPILEPGNFNNSITVDPSFGTTTGNTAELGIDFVPNLEFGKQPIKAGTNTSYQATPIKYTAADGSTTADTSSKAFVQLTDRRAGLVENSWTLTVHQDTAFTGTKTGTTLAATHFTWKPVTQTSEDATFNSDAQDLYFGSTPVVVAETNNQKGAGTTQVQFTGDTDTKGMQLLVNTEDANKVVDDTYSTTLTWALTSADSGTVV